MDNFEVYKQYEDNNENNIEHYVRSYSSTVFRRWVANYLDLFILVGVFFVSSGFSRLYSSNHKFDYHTAISIPVFLYILSYYLVFEAFTGYTIGKLALRIKVIDYNQNIPGFNRGLIRTVTRIVELNPLLIGGLIAGVAAIVSKRHQRVGDMLAKTLVVRVNELSDTKLGETIKRITVFYVAATILLSVFGFYSLVSSSIQTNKDLNGEGAPIIITNIGGDYQLKASSAWVNAIEDMKEDDSADLYLNNIRKSIEITGLKFGVEEDEVLIKPEVYTRIIASQFIKEISGAYINEVKKTKINGYDAAECTIAGSLMNQDGMMHIAVIKTKKRAYKFISWSQRQDIEQELKEIKSVIYSFKEIK